MSNQQPDPAHGNLLMRVINKIKNEQYLFIIAIALVLVGLVIYGANIGSAEFRIVAIGIIMLAVIGLIGPAIIKMIKVRRIEPVPSSSDESRDRIDMDLPSITPIFEKAKGYALCPTFGRRKEEFLKPAQMDIQNGVLILSDLQRASCSSSPWDFDRIILYMDEESKINTPFDVLFLQFEGEFERIKAADGKRSLVPLHYSTRSILKLLSTQRRPQKQAHEKKSFFQDVFEYIESRNELDQGNDVRPNLQHIIAILEQ